MGAAVVMSSAILDITLSKVWAIQGLAVSFLSVSCLMLVVGLFAVSRAVPKLLPDLGRWAVGPIGASAVSLCVAQVALAISPVSGGLVHKAAHFSIIAGGIAFTYLLLLVTLRNPEVRVVAAALPSRLRSRFLGHG